MRRIPRILLSLLSGELLPTFTVLPWTGETGCLESCLMTGADWSTQGLPCPAALGFQESKYFESEIIFIKSFAKQIEFSSNWIFAVSSFSKLTLKNLFLIFLAVQFSGIVTVPSLGGTSDHCFLGRLTVTDSNRTDQILILASDGFLMFGHLGWWLWINTTPL